MAQGVTVVGSPDRTLAGCGVTAFGSASMTLAEADARRTSPGPAGFKPVPLKFVKYADEQTIAGLSALFQAIESRGWQDRSFDDWTVIGVPRYLGRMSVAFTTNKYLSDPAWSVSPHIIPNQSLHSLSGTISVVLSIHGPNVGVGGGPNGVPEGLLAALAALQTDKVAGVWLVLTQFDPEPTPDADGKPTNAVGVRAVALALQASETPARLRLLAEPAPAADTSVADLAEYVGDPTHRTIAWRCPAFGFGTLELTLA